MPHLASALLGHKHPRITEEHYNRSSSLAASRRYAELVQKYGSASNTDTTHMRDEAPLYWLGRQFPTLC
jgi:hypothetical protein